MKSFKLNREATTHWSTKLVGWCLGSGLLAVLVFRIAVAADWYPVARQDHQHWMRSPFLTFLVGFVGGFILRLLFLCGKRCVLRGK